MADSKLDRLAARLDARHTKPRVRERILRLNPDPQPGIALRGWHPADTARRNRFLPNLISKGWIIRKFGREAWDRIPRQAITKRGRHCYVSLNDVEDRIWECDQSKVKSSPGHERISYADAPSPLTRPHRSLQTH